MNYAQLLAQVQAAQSVDDSAVALLTSLKTMLDAAIAANANGDPSQLQPISDMLTNQINALAAAVSANTPAAAASKFAKRT